jgi:hypothetical protein
LTVTSHGAIVLTSTTNRENEMTTNQAATLRVTFHVFSKVLGKEFRNVEMHRSMDDARLRACALGWTIEKVEAAQ